MTYARTAIQDFSTANKLYINAVATFYTVTSGAKTSTLATLYSTLTGTGTLANPQTLDGYGKLAQPVYIDEPVIMTITGLGNTPDHDSGIVSPSPILTGSGSPEGSVTATVGTLYLRTDGGSSTTLYVKESGSSNTGWRAV